MARLTCSCGECRKCKHRIYMAEWYRRPGHADRVRGWAKRYREENIEAVREKDRERARRKGPPNRMKARNAARVLGKGLHPCERCGVKDLRGSDGRTLIHAHHPDHDKPLEVHWLCASCHGLEHRKIA
jgi:5-methylcytosine-specific restriction endonuclease McrA